MLLNIILELWFFLKTIIAPNPATEALRKDLENLSDGVRSSGSVEGMIFLRSDLFYPCRLFGISTERM